MNAFQSALHDTFRGRKVRVTRDGTTLEGWVNKIDHSQRHVILADATDVDRDADLGAAFVSHADTIEVLESTARIESVAVDAIEPAPFAVTEFAVDENREYIDEVRNRGFAGSFPVVREADAGLQVVEGHKRFWVCRQAGLEAHPVRIVNVDDWTATRRFVDDHLPDERQVNENGSTANGRYDAHEITEAIELLVERWGERVLEIERVAYNLDRFENLDVLDESGDQDDGAVALTYDAPIGPEPPAEDDEVDEEPAPPELADEPIGPDPAAEDDVDEDELECGVDGCDFSTDSEVGVAVHQARAHDDDETEGRNLNDRIVEALEEADGELTTAEIKERTDSGASVYNELSRLQRTGDIESRKDPDNGSRKFYRIAGAPIDETEEDAGVEDPFTAAAERRREQTEADSTESDPSESASEADDPTTALAEDGDDETEPELSRESALEAMKTLTDADQPEVSSLQVANEIGANPNRVSQTLLSLRRSGDITRTAQNPALYCLPEMEPDSPEDVESESSDPGAFPRTCHCGATLKGSLELLVHRTEDHGVPRSGLDHLEPGEFEAVVERCDTFSELVEEFSWTRERTMRLLGIYGLEDIVTGDVELSDVNDFEFDGVDQEDDVGAGTDPEQVATDGGGASVLANRTEEGGFVDWSADKSAESSAKSTRCQNCGSKVTKRWAAVKTPDGEPGPRICPNCPDKTIDGVTGEIREKRTSSGDRNGE